MTTINLPEKVAQVIRKMQEAGFECFAVGGSIRDLIMGKNTKTWDFATSATPAEIQTVFPESFYENDFGTVGIKVKNAAGETEDIYEMTTFRKEGKYSDYRHPDKVEWAKTIDEDLARRELTISAIAVTIDKSGTFQIVDSYHGLDDLKNKIVRAVGNPNDRFTEDPLRMMRAIRIATQLGFTIEDKTWEGVKNNASLISKISSERIRDELIKILSSDYPADGIKLLDNAELLGFILPELTAGHGVTQKGTHHTDDVFDHSLGALRYCQNKNWVVRFATLLHDVGKPVAYVDRNGKATFYNHETIGASIARNIANRLHLSKEDREKIYMLVRWHMFSVSEFLTDSAIRRFIRRVGPENTTDMLDLRTADRLGSGVKETSWRHEDFKKRIIDVQKHIPSVKDLKVNGKDVMEILGIPPGPKIGIILNQLFEEIMEDPEKNENEYLQKRIKEIA